jgi:hypothetical protein
MTEQLLERAGGFSNPKVKLQGVRRWHLMELCSLGLRGEMTFHDNSTFDGLAMAARLRDTAVPIRSGITAEEAEVYLERWDQPMTRRSRSLRGVIHGGSR